MSPQPQVERLAAAFRRVHVERMHDMPILNPRIEVTAVGFREWQGRSAGVLVTPWFMNLVLLPGPADDWSTLRSGETCSHVFPSGSYDFLAGKADGLPYQACSLFSPVLELVDQEAAVATAEAVMQALFEAAEFRSGTELSRGGITSDNAARPSGAMAASASTVRAMDRPVSRRGLLRAVLFPFDEQ
jgi:[NiFe] hydrogenase assembly HybE family chaperone